MITELKKLTEPLDINDVDFRVQSVNGGGYATILAYKSARVDMQRLDDAIGALNWKREHTRDNKNCIVSIYDAEKKEWISKEDTGSESMADAQKGLASDSFKRACFNWGIGRELYDYPMISIKLNDEEWDKSTKKTTWKFRLKEWVWISEFKDGHIVGLACKDTNGVVRFKYGEFTKTK